MLKDTGERLLPDQQREGLLFAEHLARYRFAAQFARDRAILDAGSGEGYGAAILAAAGAASVVGLDIDEEIVQHAREKYGLEFVRGDVCELPFDEGRFDLVTCFETIEHVSAAARAVSEFRRVLRPEGLLVISTPNSKEYLVENEFHEREYTPEEFDELLADAFPQRLRLYQQNWLLSAVLDERELAAADPAHLLDVEVSKAAAVEPGGELYSVVVCGGHAGGLRQVAVATGVFEAQRLGSELDAWQDRAGKAEELLAPWQERAEKAEQLLAPWQERAEKAEQLLAPWQERAELAERQRQDWERRATGRERQLDAMEQSLSWRMTRPLRALKALVRR